MKNQNIFLFFFLLIFSSGALCAQLKINQYDSNGERNGNWEKRYSNNNIRYKGQFNHGKEVGTFKYYSSSNSKIPIIIKKFNTNNNNANVSYYLNNGKLESTGVMDGINRTGKWLYYRSNGKTIISEENYLEGKLDGVFKTYFKNGKLTEIGHYKNGLLNGNYKKYSTKGFLFQDLNYIAGKLNGIATYYDKNTGKIMKSGNFDNDKKTGDWKHYKNGKLVSTGKPSSK